MGMPIKRLIQIGFHGVGRCEASYYMSDSLMFSMFVDECGIFKVIAKLKEWRVMESKV